MIPDFGRGCGFGDAHVFAVAVDGLTGAPVAGTGSTEAVFGRSGVAVAVAAGVGFSSGASVESSTDGAAVATRILEGGVSVTAWWAVSALGAEVFSTVRPVRSFARITPAPTANTPMAAPTAILVFLIAERCSLGIGIFTIVGSELRPVSFRRTLMITFSSCL